MSTAPPRKPIADEWLTERQIAEEAGVSPFTVRRWRLFRGLKAIKLGRSWKARRSWYEAWIENQAEPISCAVLPTTAGPTAAAKDDGSDLQRALDMIRLGRNSHAAS